MLNIANQISLPQQFYVVGIRVYHLISRRIDLLFPIFETEEHVGSVLLFPVLEVMGLIPDRDSPYILWNNQQMSQCAVKFYFSASPLYMFRAAHTHPSSGVQS